MLTMGLHSRNEFGTGVAAQAAPGNDVFFVGVIPVNTMESVNMPLKVCRFRPAKFKNSAASLWKKALTFPAWSRIIGVVKNLRLVF